MNITPKPLRAVHVFESSSMMYWLALISAFVWRTFFPFCKTTFSDTSCPQFGIASIFFPASFAISLASLSCLSISFPHESCLSAAQLVLLGFEMIEDNLALDIVFFSYIKTPQTCKTNKASRLEGPKTPDARFELATNGLTVSGIPTLNNIPQKITTIELKG